MGAGLHWPREWAEEVNLGWCSGRNGNDFIKLYIVFDYQNTYEWILFVVGSFFSCCAVRVSHSLFLCRLRVLVCFHVHIRAGQGKSNHLPTRGTRSPYGYCRVTVVLERGETQVVNAIEVKRHAQCSRKMAQPSGHVILGAEEAQATEERYTALEVQLQALR